MFLKKEKPEFEIRPLYSIREELELIKEFCWQPKLAAGKIYTEEEIDAVEQRLAQDWLICVFFMLFGAQFPVTAPHRLRILIMGVSGLVQPSIVRVPFRCASLDLEYSSGRCITFTAIFFRKASIYRFIYTAVR